MARGPLLSAPARYCPICGQKRVRQARNRTLLKTCGKRLCFRQLMRQLRSSANLTAANIALKQMRDDRMRAVLMWQFGAFTDRDRALFAAVWKFAWNRGYTSGVRRAAKRQQEAAA